MIFSIFNFQFYKELSMAMRTFFISLFGILFCSISENTKAQGFGNAIYELKYHRGNILPHYKSFQYVMGRRIPTYEVNVKWQTHGNKDWHVHKNFPEIGFGLFYSGLQKREILGQAFGGHLLSQFKIFEYKGLSLNYRMSFGLVYITKKYDFHTNPHNLLIGTHFNALIHTGFNFSYRIKNRFDTSLGLSLIHFSNGDFSRPNAGLNQLSINAGIAYRMKSYRKPQAEKKPFDAFGQFMISVAGGIHRTSFTDETKHTIASLSTDYQYYISRGSGFALGFDLFYDAALAKYTVLDSIRGNPVDNPIYGGLHAAYLFKTGNTLFEFHTGPYLFGRKSISEKIYTRLVLRQQILRNIYIHIALKTFFSKADFVEWGCSVALPAKKTHRKIIATE